MIRMWFSFLLTLFVLSSYGQDTTRVLFVGNSYTYFWNLPQVVQGLAQSQGYPLVTAQSTIGGANLGQHWRGERGLETHHKLENGNWDYVVLQDHSLRGIEARDSLNLYVQKWKQEIIAHGATPLLYMTWPRSFNPMMGDPIREAYESLGKRENITVVPAGLSWSKARHLRSDIDLYDPDGSHPAPLGTYLTALTFYKSITHQTVDGLPSRLISEDRDGEKLYLMIVPTRDASFCQDIVEAIFNEYPSTKIRK